MTTDIDWVPGSACTLPTAERPLRVAEFDALFAAHLTGTERLAETRARLTLTRSPGVARQAQDLADRETGCCSFFTFAITEEAESVSMDISVPGTHGAVLEALVARAESSRGGGLGS